MVFRILIIGLLFLYGGCTHIRELSSYDQINRHVSGMSVRITLIDSTIIKAKNVHIGPDSSWILTGTLSKQIVPTSKIKYITVLNRGRGALEGFCPFFIAGAVLGIAGLISGDDPPGIFSFTAKEKFMMFTLSGFLEGVLIGGPIGALIGSKDKYVMPPKKSSKENSQARKGSNTR